MPPPPRASAPPAAPHVAVVVLNWNGLADTRACLASLLAQDHEARELHVVDNGSAGGEADALAAEYGDRIRLHRLAANLGFTGGNNAALRAVLAEGRARYVALLNNDAEAEPGWLSSLVTAAERHPDAGIFASLMLLHDRPDLVENTGIVLLSSGEAMPRDRLRRADRVRRANRPIGACAGAVLYRCAMLREVGLLREEFFANFEDVDLSLRALAKGWDCRYVPAARVRHRLSRSVRKVRDERFLLRSQRNLLEAYWIDLPWPVLLLNLPSQLVAHLVLLLLVPLCGQRQMARVLWRSRLTLWRHAGRLRACRAAFGPRRRGAWWRLWWRQRNFVGAYLRSFVQVVLLRRRRFFE